MSALWALISRGSILRFSGDLVFQVETTLLLWVRE